MEADGEDTELPGQETDAGVGVAVEVAGEVAEDFDLLGGDGGATDEGEGGETDVPEAEELGRGEVVRGVGEGVCGGDGGGAEVASGKKGGKGSGWGWLRGPEGRREGLGGERVEVLGVAEVGEVAGDGRVWVLGRHRRGGGDGGRRAERGRGRGRGGRGRGRHEGVVGRGAEGRAAAVSGGGLCGGAWRCGAHFSSKSSGPLVRRRGTATGRGQVRQQALGQRSLDLLGGAADLVARLWRRHSACGLS